MHISDKLKEIISQGKPVSSYFKRCQMTIFNLSCNDCLVSGDMNLGLRGNSIFMLGSWERKIVETGVATDFMLISDKDKDIFIGGTIGTGKDIIGFIPRILSNFLGAEHKEEKRPDICLSSISFHKDDVFNLNFFCIGLK